MNDRSGIYTKLDTLNSKISKLQLDAKKNNLNKNKHQKFLNPKTRSYGLTVRIKSESSSCGSCKIKRLWKIGVTTETVEYLTPDSSFVASV
ncbi:hypothetical protein BpHYR1_023723 [Brachionus plicatilis]|uniref:Uncharacterized protein n=1 Tax=Brachionus plicatilis TaxID=10195 RepID=A0A3M7RTM4_BRAPC|nr:hypothetical protein BpHYR1_023723 [Brachionus plicatilis]